MQNDDSTNLYKTLYYQLIGAIATVNKFSPLGDHIYDVRDGKDWEHPDVIQYGNAVNYITSVLEYTHAQN